MGTINISKARLKELERKERILRALEAGGVDNWEWYEESLSKVTEEERFTEELDGLLQEIAFVLLRRAYEPSERGAGFTSHEEDYEEALDILTAFAKKNFWKERV